MLLFGRGFLREISGASRVKREYTGAQAQLQLVFAIALTSSISSSSPTLYRDFHFHCFHRSFHCSTTTVDAFTASTEIFHQLPRKQLENAEASIRVSHNTHLYLEQTNEAEQGGLGRSFRGLLPQQPRANLAAVFPHPCHFQHVVGREAIAACAYACACGRRRRRRRAG